MPNLAPPRAPLRTGDSPPDDLPRAAEGTRRRRRRGSSRAPALDGLRGLAVLAVVLFHAGVSWAPGGLLGVDAFFVLSGYLITSLLLAEHARTGRISLPDFWRRRVRRLLPAALLLVTVAGVVWRLTASASSWHSLRGDAIATLTYWANWHFAFTGQGYFDHYNAPSPLLHMWSLGVEEQFYLLWPLLVVLLLRGRSAVAGRRRVFVVSGVGIAASSGLAALLFGLGIDTSRIYYGTDTRATALLAGAALACVLPLVGGSGLLGMPGRHRPSRPGPARGVAVLLGLVGIATLGWAILRVDGSSPWLYNGGFLVVALAVVLAICSVVLVPGGLLARALSQPALVGLGRISYGVYLWHWPVFLFLTAGRVGVSGITLFALRITVTLLAALASWVLLERPVLARRLRIPLPGLAAAATVAAVGVAFLAVPLPAGTTSRTPDLSALQRLSNDTGLPAATTRNVAGRPARVLIVGDSVALTMGVGMDQLAKEQNVVFADRGWVGCGIASGGPVRFQGKVGNASPDCDLWLQHWLEDTARVKPDVVGIMVGRWELVDRYYNGRMRAVGDRVYDDYLRHRLNAGIDALLARGTRVALMTEPCSDGFETADGSTASEDDPARWRHFTDIVRSTATRYPASSVQLYDVADQFCPGGRYRAVDTHGVPLRTDDGVHITKEGGLFVGRWLLPQLVAFARQDRTG